MGFLANLSPQQRIIVLGGGIVAILLVLGIVVSLALNSGKKSDQPSAKEQESGYIAIFKHLEPKEQDEAAAALKTHKVKEFKFTEDGTLYVAKDKEVEARVALGEAQVPKNPVSQGLEIFNKKDFISTDFDKRIAFLRALNGELTRMVRKIEGVEDASVLVNMPEDTLFQAEKKAITASIMVKMQPGKDLTPGQVEGIQHMIASAVPGLNTDNVTVVDDNGNLKSSGLSSNTGDQGERLAARQIDQQLKVTRAMETDLQNSLQILLDKLVGAGKSVVRVKLELDFNKRQVRNRLMAPVTANGEPLAGSKSVQRETVKSGGANATTGLPGTAGNLPTYPILPGQPGAAPGAPGSEKGETLRENIREQYSFNQEDQVVQTASGNIRRMSIAVLLPETVKQEAVDKLRNVIATAAGADPARRDQVTVERVRFDTSLVDQLKAELTKKEEAKKTAKKKSAFSWTLVGWISVGVLVFFFLLSLFLRRRRPAENPFETLTTSLESDALPGFDQAALGGFQPEALGYGQQPGGFGEMPGYQMSGADAYGGTDQYGAQSYEQPQAQSGGGGFDFLYNVAPEQVAEFLAAERPATAAGVLAQLDSNFAETVIANMSPEVQGEVFNRLQQGANLPAMTQRMVAQNLRRKLGVPV
jgi:flagellar M-ring protein FliF